VKYSDAKYSDGDGTEMITLYSFLTTNTPIVIVKLSKIMESRTLDQVPT